MDRTWIPPRYLHLGRNVGGFVGHSRGVDKIDEVLMHRSGACISPDFFPRTVSGVLSLGSEPGVVPQDLPVPLRVTRPFSRRSRTDVAVLPQDSGSRGYLSRRSPARSVPI